MKLKYIGNEFLPGVPARDLTEDEVEECGGEQVLLASGLYAEDKPATKADKTVGKTAEKEGE